MRRGSEPRKPELSRVWQGREEFVEKTSQKKRRRVREQRRAEVCQEREAEKKKFRELERF